MRKQKIISELETQINKQGEIIRYYEKKFEEISKFQDSIPADCKRGDYCRACEFSEEIHVRKGLCVITINICKKGCICPNFCQKVDNGKFATIENLDATNVSINNLKEYK